MTENGPIEASRRLARRIGLLLTPAVCNLVNAAPAWAAGGAAVGAIWIGVTDSAGVPLGIYGLSLNNGSLTDPAAAPSAFGMHWFYGYFLSIIGLAIWLVTNVLSFRWLAVISQPFDFIGAQLTAMVHSPAVLLAVGLAATCVIAINVALGKIGRAAAQTTVAILLAYLAVAIGNKPVSELIGPNGALAMGRDIGVEIVSELSGKPFTGDKAVATMTEQLADHFARTPTLAWNFGVDLDAAPYNCGAVWSNAITTGPIDKVKDAVEKGCPNGHDLHEYAMSDPANRKVVAFFSIVFALTVLIVFGYLCGLVVILALSAIFWAMVACVALVTGWIPGGSQALAIKAGLDALFSFAGMTAMVALVGITGNLAAAMFSAVDSDVAVAMPMVSLLMVALFFALRRVRKGLVSGRERSVQAVQRFTGSGSEPGHAKTLDQIDPLTMVPNAAQNLSRLTRGAVKTGVKHGVTAVAPEAAPFLAAGDQLQHRLNAKNLKGGKRSDTKKSKSSSAYDVTSTANEPPATGDARSGASVSTRAAAASSTAAAINKSHEARTSAPPPVEQGTTAGTSTSQPRPAAARSPRPTAAEVTDLRTPPQTRMPADSTDTAVTSSDSNRPISPLLCGAKTSRGDRCINSATSCPHHPRRAGRPDTEIHWAIADLAKLDDHDFDDANSFTEFYSDIRAQFMGRNGPR